MATSYSTLSPARLSREGLAPRNSDENGNEGFEATAYHKRKSAVDPLEALIARIPPRATRSDQWSISPSPEPIPVAWYCLDSEHQGTHNVHGNYWWRICGYALAVLLGNADYSYAAQIRILDFFARCIAPKLGIANEPGVERWKSFMTDDHNPIELSWDWYTGSEPPKIRFSVEPVGEAAGTAKDPRNELVAGEFLKDLLRELPTMSMQWFYHFDSYFRLGTKNNSPAGHHSQMFWAFDLNEKDVTVKAYFFPEYRAHATHKTNVQVISEAIETAPFCRPEDLSVLYTFQDFVREHARIPLEMDMLAIDLVEPLQSRLKIYIRTRETSFESVREAMTLGGRFTDSDTETGLQSLRRLWDSLFDQHGVPDTWPLLPGSKHRTAGILYNVEFRLGSKAPKVKVYIPVRHYAQNDWQVMKAVSDFMSHSAPQDVGAGSCSIITTPLKKNKSRRRSPFAFCDAMCSIL